MDADEAVSENLKMQFKTLQEQQQKRMQNLMEKKKESPSTLGLDCNHRLDQAACLFSRLLETENEQLQHQLRELVDENGRLFKLLKERDLEIKQLHKKIEEERQALLDSGPDHQLQISTVKLQTHGDSPAFRKKADTTMSPEVKALHEKLSAVNLKASEYRNQLQSTKQELKMTQKLLTNEVGVDVNIQNLLSNPGSWRGRAQQILVRELETQLNCHKSKLSENDANEDPLSLTDSRKSSAQVKNHLRIRTLEREKKEALEKLMNQYQVLQNDHEDVKKKLEGSKARNKVLSNESQQKEMQGILKNLSQQEDRNVEGEKAVGKKLNAEIQKQNCLIEQLKQMVAEREAQVKELEEMVRQLRLQSGLDSGSTLSAESLEEENQNLATKKEDYSRTDSSVSALELNNIDFRTLQAQITEYKTLCQAAEKSLKFGGFVSSLQDQYPYLTIHLVSTAPSFSSTKMSWNAGDKKDLPSVQLSEVPLESQLEELSTQLVIQMDEIEGLKNALQESIRTKEEDFRVYQDTVGQVKEIFLHALKQHAQEKN
ncbi:hypothetical protein Chor_014586 [Crotalus horridus]